MTAPAVARAPTVLDTIGPTKAASSASVSAETTVPPTIAEGPDNVAIAPTIDAVIVSVTNMASAFSAIAPAMAPAPRRARINPIVTGAVIAIASAGFSLK